MPEVDVELRRRPAAAHLARSHVDEHDPHCAGVGSPVGVDSAQAKRLSRCHGDSRCARELGHVRRPGLVQDRTGHGAAPGRLGGEQILPARDVVKLEPDPAPVQMAAAADEKATVGARPAHRAAVDGEPSAGARHVERRIRPGAVADVQPDRPDRCELLADDVLHRVAHVPGQHSRRVVHEHVQEPPPVGTSIGVAVARWKPHRSSLLALRIEALRQAPAGRVGSAELGDHDVVEHHPAPPLNVTLGVDDLCSHADDEAVDRGRRRQRRRGRDPVGRHDDRPGSERQRLRLGSRNPWADQRKRGYQCEAAENPHAKIVLAGSTIEV